MPESIVFCGMHFATYFLCGRERRRVDAVTVLQQPGVLRLHFILVEMHSVNFGRLHLDMASSSSVRTASRIKGGVGELWPPPHPKTPSLIRLRKSKQGCADSSTIRLVILQDARDNRIG